VPTLVFGFAERALLGGAGFCAACPWALSGRCDPAVAHRFGCYQAERWDGQYVYYCPVSFTFVATLVDEDGRPGHGLVAGPLVMGEVEDLVDDLDPALLPRLAELPRRSAAAVGALARVQQAMGRHLAGSAVARFAGAGEVTRSAAGAEAAPSVTSAEAGGRVTSADPPPAGAHRYPVDVERRLVAMIRRGDRAGAAELINQLLGALYLAHNGDFRQLRQGAIDLITVFSRAAIEGGADADSIFGEKRALDRRLAGFTTRDELSAFLVTVFNRFVGYVFDFSQFEHANILRRVVDYVRANYAGRVSLADAARAVHLSPNYLSSVFSAEMGMSFTAYVQKVRLDQAKKLLLGTYQPIAAIAAATGFTDQSYFAKVFAQAMGMTPGQYRRQAG
jgi:AraC-like DNA-binding protein